MPLNHMKLRPSICISVLLQQLLPGTAIGKIIQDTKTGNTENPSSQLSDFFIKISFFL